MNDVQFLETIVKGIVLYPDDVRVHHTVDEMGTLLTLDVNPMDMGRIIGKEGNTAKAIRTILRTHGAIDNVRLSLKITDPRNG